MICRKQYKADSEEKTKAKWYYCYTISVILKIIIVLRRLYKRTRGGWNERASTVKCVKQYYVRRKIH